MKPSTDGLTYNALRSPGPTVVCKWCDSLMRTGDNGRVSHGICPACEAKFYEDMGEDIPDVGEAGGARGRSLGHDGPPSVESRMGDEPTSLTPGASTKCSTESLTKGGD